MFDYTEYRVGEGWKGVVTGGRMSWEIVPSKEYPGGRIVTREKNEEKSMQQKQKKNLLRRKRESFLLQLCCQVLRS